MPRIARLLPLLLVLSTASACSMFNRSIEKPTADVRALSMSTISFRAVEGELHLDVANPNGFGVPLSGIDWQLAVGGARAVTGRVELSQTIPARGVAPVVTTLRLDPGDVPAVAAQLSRGARDYQLSMRLAFSTPIGPLTVDLEHRGSLAGAGGLLGAVY
jgi:LEA14-like dessication related protein